MLYKHLITKTTLTDISTNRTLNIVVYHQTITTHTHTHTHTQWHAHTSLHSSTQVQQLINYINNTKLSLSSHPPTTCLLLLPGPLMFSPPPFLPPPSPYPYASIYIQQPHTGTPFFRFYWKIWANRTVFSWDLNWDDVGTFLKGEPAYNAGRVNPTESEMVVSWFGLVVKL